jgi:hypothetical protein
MNDSYLFARRPMLNIGTITSDVDWESRKDDFYDILRIQFPLGQLRASEVIFDYATSKSGVDIRAFLQRSAQGLLWLSESENFASDPFEEDVRLIKGAAKNIREKFEAALKGSDDPALNPNLARRRALMVQSRPEKNLLLFSRPEGEWMPLGEVPKRMPHALVAEANFCVEQIRRDVCRVRALNLKISADGPPETREFRTRHLQGKVDLYREDCAKGEIAGAVFSKALETGVLVRARVQLAFSWVDGTAERWSIHVFPRLLDQKMSPIA